MHVGAETLRPAIAILVGGWGDITLTLGGESKSSRAFLVAANVRRGIRAEHGFYSFNLEPTHRLAGALRVSVLGSSEVVDVAGRLDARLQAQIETAIKTPKACSEAYALSEDILQACFEGLSEHAPVDPRIFSVAHWLREHLPTRLQLDELTQMSGLSSSRLRHLFTEQLGISIKSYLLAMKMRKAAELFGADFSLTEVAHRMGFADSAHLTRAFRAYFSVTPSLLANRQLVDLCVCRQNIPSSR